MCERFMKKMMRFCLLGVCLMFVIAGKAHAQGGVFTPGNFTLEIPEGIKLLVSDATPIGTVLWASPPVTTNLVRGTGVSTDAGIWWKSMNLTEATSPYIFATNVPGIGVRFLLKLNTPYLYNVERFVSAPYSTAGSAGIASPTASYPQQATLHIVKTSNAVSNGKVIFNPSLQLFTMDFNCVNGCQKFAYFVSGGIEIESKPVCSVHASSELIDVELGRVYAHQFTGVNSTSQPKDFTIKMACKGGTPNSKTRAYITLTDSNQPGNFSKVLSLTGPKPAGGLGIQIKRGSTILGYGPDSGVIGNTNQWVAGDINYGESELSVPLTASYVQTGAKVTQGPAHAKATFNISYN